MKNIHRLLTCAAILVPSLTSAPAVAQTQDDYLAEVHSVLRVADSQVIWVPNEIGGLSPWVTFNVKNQYDLSLLVPVTSLNGNAGNWAGGYQLWIERLGPDPTIPPIENTSARDGRRYAAGGNVVAWPGQIIGPRGFTSLSQPLLIGGFPSGQYAVYVEYLTTHERVYIQHQVVYFNVP